MEFRFRENEINEIDRLRWLSEEQYTRVLMVTGFPGVGKSSLVKHALGESKAIYLYVGNKTNELLFKEFAFQMKHVLGIDATKGTLSFSSLLDVLFAHSTIQSFTVVIDEFHRLPNETLAHLADILATRRRRTNLNLILISSDEILSKKLTEPDESILYNCIDSVINLQPFTPSEMKTVFYEGRDEKSKGSSKEDFLLFYTVTGGLPSLVKRLKDSTDILSDIVSPDSFYLNLGYDILSPRLGKNAEIYFSILEAIATGSQSQQAIEKYVGTSGNVGGHLLKLESVYNLVERKRPAYSREDSRGVVRYFIKQPFLEFWFRYIACHKSDLELGEFAYVKKEILYDLKEFSKDMLTRFFMSKLLNEGGYSFTEGWWKPSSKEDSEPSLIPIVASTYNRKKVLLAEVCLRKEDFEKDKFLTIVNQFKNSSHVLTGVDSVLFVLEDI